MERASLNIVTMLDYRKCSRSYQSILAAGPAEINADISEKNLCETDIPLRERDPITTLYPFAAVAEDLQLCFKLLCHNPSVLDEESLRSVSQEKRSVIVLN